MLGQIKFQTRDAPRYSVPEPRLDYIRGAWEGAVIAVDGMPRAAQVAVVFTEGRSKGVSLSSV